MIRNRIHKVADVMTGDIEVVRPNTTIAEAAKRMRDLDCGSLPVCDQDGRILGIITDRDIAVRAIAQEKDPKATRVMDVMTHRVVSCNPDTSVDEAEELMQRHQIRRLPVVDDDDVVVGILTLGKLARIGNEKHSGRVLKEVSQKEHREPGYQETRPDPQGHEGTTSDPVCGMQINSDMAANEVVHEGEKYQFCSIECRDKFLQDPGKYTTPAP